ncbi:S ribonuclease [Pyrus ussuriensis x Pyrus communis]|uniref:S ribonuclease n=1 Tax=Pyrus ussuriensis x Pyrus communis TaxID=2448454 RepID=A0A5N5EY24_9ROSA|nr:S ribonuclease [Pyrus ussuriensis x Pyrus communis]
MVAAGKVVHERRIIWDDLPVIDDIQFDNLIEKYKLYRFVLSKSKCSGTHQRGSIIHPFQKNLGDICPRTTKDLDKNLMNLSNVMSVVTQSGPRSAPPPNVSQERKIAHIEFKINSLRKQFFYFKSLVSQSASSPFVSYSFSKPSEGQTSMNPPYFVPKPSLCLPKLVHQCLLDPSSFDVAAKMVAIYDAKRKGVSINVHQHFSYTPTSKSKHISFTYSNDDNEEGFGSITFPRDASVEGTIPTGSPDYSDDSSHSDEF